MTSASSSSPKKRLSFFSYHRNLFGRRLWVGVVSIVLQLLFYTVATPLRIVIIWSSLGTSFLSFVAGFQGMDKKLFEAGAVDGIQNRFQELWFITLPSIRPQMMFGAVMSITQSFGVGAVISQIFGFPSTGYALYTMVHELEDYGNIRFEMGYASAIATILFIIMIVSNKVVQNLLSKVGQ